MLRKIIIIISMTIIALMSFNFGKIYALNNIYIEQIECQHDNAHNFDYAIYLDQEIRIY